MSSGVSVASSGSLEDEYAVVVVPSPQLVVSSASE